MRAALAVLFVAAVLFLVPASAEAQEDPTTTTSTTEAPAPGPGSTEPPVDDGAKVAIVFLGALAAGAMTGKALFG